MQSPPQQGLLLGVTNLNEQRLPRTVIGWWSWRDNLSKQDTAHLAFHVGAHGCAHKLDILHDGAVR